MIARVNTPDLHSIGQLAATARQRVPAIRQAAQRLGITPALKLNGCPYFTGPDAARIVAASVQVQTLATAGEAGAENNHAK